MRVSTTVFQNAFGKYLKAVMNGEDVIVTKNGRGVAKLINYEDPMVYMVKEGVPEYYIRKRVTYDEYLEITEKSESRYELINGEIHLMSSPKHQHQLAIREIFGQMYNYFQGQSCSPFTSPYDVRLFNDSARFEDDPNVVQPDLLVMCDEDTIDNHGVYHGIPTLVVEVLSPSTRSKDMTKKLSLYMKSGIKEYWIVDLKNRKVFIYIFCDKSIVDLVTVSFDQVVESFCFSGLQVTLKEV